MCVALWFKALSLLKKLSTVCFLLTLELSRKNVNFNLRMSLLHVCFRYAEELKEVSQFYDFMKINKAANFLFPETLSKASHYQS